MLQRSLIKNVYKYHKIEFIRTCVQFIFLIKHDVLTQIVNGACVCEK